ncbi:MAG: hypothetical protein QM754_15560 [Tepidisphaeraceae bacterium]
MPAKSAWGSRDFCVPSKLNVAHADDSAFAPLTATDVREAFAVPATHPPILSLEEAAELVKLRPQTLKRKVSEGLYSTSVVRGKPLRFWRDRLVLEVMR